MEKKVTLPQNGLCTFRPLRPSATPLIVIW